MDAPLQDCTIEERSGVVRFLWGRRSETCGNSSQYVGSVWTEHVSRRKVYEWVERFKSGRTHVTDEGRSGRPSTSRSRKASSPQEYRN